jgi:hypothetical protein
MSEKEEKSNEHDQNKNDYLFEYLGYQNGERLFKMNGYVFPLDSEHLCPDRILELKNFEMKKDDILVRNFKEYTHFFIIEVF